MSRMPTWRVEDGPNAPTLLRDKNALTAGSAAGQRPAKLVLRPLRCGAAADVPWLDPGGLRGCHRRCPKPVGRRGQHRPFASVANKSRRYADANWADAGRT